MVQNYFLYVRKSTDTEERQVLSIESQLAELKLLAEKENLRISHIFQEAMTAKVPGRPIFNEMISRIEKGEADGIIAWHPDRLARNSIDGGRVITSWTQVTSNISNSPPSGSRIPLRGNS